MCGTPLSSDTLNYKNGRKPSYRYKCTKQPGRKDICGNLSVTGPETDKFVVAVVLDALSTEGATSGRQHLGRNAVEVESAEERIRLAEEKKKRHFDSLRKGTLDQDQYDLLVSDINKQIRIDLRTVRSYSPVVQQLISDAPRERGELDAWFESLEVDDQREVIRGVLLGVTVLPSKPRRSLDVARFTNWDWAYAASDSTDERDESA